jgi:hypothetical protein
VQLRRNPVPHLANAFADNLQRAAAALADHVVEPYVVTRQIVGQRLAAGRGFRLLFVDKQTALPFARKITVEMFQSERELIGIKQVGTAAELRTPQRLGGLF